MTFLKEKEPDHEIFKKKASQTAQHKWHKDVNIFTPNKFLIDYSVEHFNH